MQALPHWGTVPALKNLSLPIETNIKNRELKDKCSRSSLQLTHSVEISVSFHFCSGGQRHFLLL